MLEHYGFEVNRAGFCRSPFADNDKTPSLKVYSGTRGWHDFSSGKGGDVIDFVREYFGISFSEAQKKINADFKLGLPIGQRVDEKSAAEAKKMALERERRQEERRRARERVTANYEEAQDQWIELDRMWRNNRPRNPDEVNEQFLFALDNIGYARYIASVAEDILYNFGKTGLQTP